MANIEKAFAKLIGRQPSETEVANLYRVRDALGLRENDALWLVLVALESYDSLYRKYPEMISTQIQAALEAQRASIATMAEHETRRALGTLADAVSRTSETVSSRVVQARLMQGAALLSMALLVFGSFCAAMGFVLGSGRLPWWATVAESQGFAAFFLSTLALTPAGWLAAVIGGVLALGALWHARKEIVLYRRGDLVVGSALILGLAAGLLWSAT